MSDLIRREDAVDEIDKWFENHEEHHSNCAYDDGVKQGMFLAMSILRNLSSAERTGEWIRHSIGHQNIPWGYDCSACGKWFVIGDDTAEQYNYCPHCGAKMEVEHEQ